ncbi:uncharacterized protein LOC114319005 [Camellia sinensis]|uniref:uncharacterized protein LOC114319005 n=1 Tax=Camellia sinensis TaxID=4442 RepID=UPI001035B3AB|nr:uncharacterized protein LOC114319005 [Camellia sinensis]
MVLTLLRLRLEDRWILVRRRSVLGPMLRRTAIFGNTGVQNQQADRKNRVPWSRSFSYEEIASRHRIIIDGSWMKDTSLAEGAWVALDEFDNQIVSHTAAFFALSASTTEAKACLDAVRQCVDHNVETVNIYTDSHALINELSCGSAKAWIGCLLLRTLRCYVIRLSIFVLQESGTTIVPKSGFWVPYLKKIQPLDCVMQSSPFNVNR